MTQEEAIISLKESTTLSDWNARVDAIKQAHGGDYPSWWYRAVVMSRLADDVAANWNGSTQIEITNLVHA